MEFTIAEDIKNKIEDIVARVEFPHIESKRIICFRSFGSKSRALARIWSFPRIWQMALKVKAHYCIEVLNPRFDKLPEDKQTKTLIHELLHIPKNFSGALLPHRARRRYGINKRSVEKLFKEYKNKN